MKSITLKIVMGMILFAMMPSAFASGSHPGKVKNWKKGLSSVHNRIERQEASFPRWIHCSIVLS